VNWWSGGFTLMEVKKDFFVFVVGGGWFVFVFLWGVFLGWFFFLFCVCLCLEKKGDANGNRERDLLWVLFGGGVWGFFGFFCLLWWFSVP